MGSRVLSLRLDDELLERIRQHAAKRGMSVQDYVVRTLVREDFDERFQSSVDATERLGGWGDTAPEAADGSPAAHG
ncbi:BrnA antitoxin family protein [Streptomyces sp. NBC_01525]|uniref:ribbon-helix-helix protein, CopG family n=1 Tax=Streptomyces sp. NBC_01525 TaxID=2903893 RepID=UPI00386B9FA5